MTAGESMNGGIVVGGDGDIEDGHLVELVEASLLPSDEPDDPPSSDAAAPVVDASVSISDDQITPLLPKQERSKINIFTISYPKRKSNKVIFIYFFILIFSSWK